jgi:6-phosphogluconolactonase
MPRYELLTYAGPEELAAAAADAWLDAIAAAHHAGRPYCVALSGGRITAKFFAAIVAKHTACPVPFDHVHFFWADERCVPPDAPDSNYRMAAELLFGPLRISPEKIHRLRGEDFPQAAAKSAEEELQRVIEAGQEGLPIIDLVLLGMGEDGHVASLFPGAPAKIVDSFVPFIVVENSPKPPPTRISLGYKMIFASKNVWILISGADKSAALRASLSATGQTPLARVIAARPVKIFSDINKF